jgi:hypothetical protein
MCASLNGSLSFGKRKSCLGDVTWAELNVGATEADLVPQEYPIYSGRDDVNAAAKLPFALPAA